MCDVKNDRKGETIEREKSEVEMWKRESKREASVSDRADADARGGQKLEEEKKARIDF